MKTVFLNEEALKNIYSSNIIDTLPDDIMTAIKHDETSIGNNPAIPDMFGDKFVEKIAKKRFADIKESMDTLFNGEISEPINELSKILNECMEIERPNRDKLEKICLNFVTNLLNIPEDAVVLSTRLVDEIEYNSESFILDPIKDDNYAFNDFREAKEISMEILKRKMIDALCVGAGMDFSSQVNGYLVDVAEVDERLPELYEKFIVLNDYILFTKEDLELTDEDKKQIGIVNVKLGQEDEKPVISAQGEIFPVLLSELIHGLFELFASHGLPKDLSLTREILKRSDYIKANPWDMRIGQPLWEILFSAITADKGKTQELPYLFKRIVQLPVKKFNMLMRETLTKTRRGEALIARLLEKARKDRVQDKYKEKLTLSNTDKTIITDDYLFEEEF